MGVRHANLQFEIVFSMYFAILWQEIALRTVQVWFTDCFLSNAQLSLDKLPLKTVVSTPRAGV